MRFQSKGITGGSALRVMKRKEIERGSAYLGREVAVSRMARDVLVLDVYGTVFDDCG